MHIKELAYSCWWYEATGHIIDIRRDGMYYLRSLKLNKANYMQGRCEPTLDDISNTNKAKKKYMSALDHIQNTDEVNELREMLAYKESEAYSLRLLISKYKQMNASLHAFNSQLMNENTILENELAEANDQLAKSQEELEDVKIKTDHYITWCRLHARPVAINPAHKTDISRDTQLNTSNTITHSTNQ